MEKKRLLSIIMVLVLVSILFYTNIFNLTGLVAQDQTRYSQLKQCIEGGTELKQCRLDLGVLPVGEFQRQGERIEMKEDYIPPPFEALQFRELENGVEIKPWGRIYVFTKGPLPTTLKSQGDNIFASEPLFKININDQETILDWSKPEVIETSTGKILLRSQAQIDSLTATADTTIEYDGMIKVDLTLEADDNTVIDEYYYEFLTQRHIARFFNHHIEYDYQNLNVDKRKLGDSSGLFPREKKLDFVPTVSIGNYLIGLEWWSETDAFWTYTDKDDDEKRSKPITLKVEDNTAKLKINPLASSLNLNSGQSWSDTFAIFPAPMRPSPENWRNKRFISSGSFGQYLSKNRESETKLYSITFASPGVRYHPKWIGLPWVNEDPELKTEQKIWLDTWDPYFEFDGKDLVGFIPYGTLTRAPGLHSRTMENFEQWAALKHDRAWMTGTGPAEKIVLERLPDYEQGDRYSYMVCAARKDYFDWILEENMKAVREGHKQFNGLYFDFGSISRMCVNNPTLEGKEEWKQSWEYFNVRDFYKRLYTQIQQERPEVILTSHTHGQPRAISVFMDFNLIGEALNNRFCTVEATRNCHDTREKALNYEPDYIDGLPNGWIEGMVFPNFGGKTTIIPQIDWAVGDESEELIDRTTTFQRGFHALTLVNDIHILMGNYIHDLGREIYRKMDIHFGNLGKATFHPWWSNSDKITSPEGIKATIYANEQTGKALIIVANLNENSISGTVRLNLDSLGIPSATNYKNIEDEEPAPAQLTEGSFNIEVPGKDFRLIVVE